MSQSNATDGSPPNDSPHGKMTCRRATVEPCACVKGSPVGSIRVVGFGRR